MAQKALWLKGNAPVAQWIEQWIPNNGMPLFSHC